LPPDIISEQKKPVIEIEYNDEDPVEVVKARNMQRKYDIENNDLNDLHFLIYYYLKEEMKNHGLELDIFAPAYYHGVWTDTDLMQAMILDPDTSHEHFNLCTTISLRYIEKYKQLGIRHIGIGGDFAGNRPIISPQNYREFIVPEILKLSNYIHRFDAWAVNASDGNLWDVVEDFLINTNVDAYMEIDMNAGMDLKKLKEAYGEQITFYGNMDCGTVLSFASEEEVKKYTVECIEAGMGNGGHIFTSSNAITSSVPVGNYLAMVNAYRAYFGLKKIKL
jgi:uroporphyrinogen-III decarboxylase